MSLVIVGSVAFDTIETPWERKEKIVGGSGTYCALAASYFTRPKIVAVVGEDFPRETIDFLQEKEDRPPRARRSSRAGRPSTGRAATATTPTSGRPSGPTSTSSRISAPRSRPSYKKADILFLANIDPDIQESVFRQVEKPKLTAMDTIGLWINSKPEALLRVLKKSTSFSPTTRRSG